MRRPFERAPHPSFLSLIKKYIYVCYFVRRQWTGNLGAQVADSTFGILSSFIGSSINVYATTACDFDSRNDRAFAALHLDDGRIILAGHTQGTDGTDFALTRLLPDGKYDETLGPQGELRIDLGYTNDSCLAAVRYQNDHLLMGGCVTPPGQAGYVNLLIRTDFDGVPDPAFGNNGQVLLDLPSHHEMITKILPLPDGKVLVGGNAFYGTVFPFPDSTAVFIGRLYPDGQIDSTFGVNGFMYQRFEHTCSVSLLGDLVVDHSGRLLLTGGSYHPYPGNYGGSDLCTHAINLFRYLPNGLPDPDFADNGRKEIPFSEGRGNSLYVYEDGRILLAGVTSDFLTDPVYTFLTRLLPNGTADSTFAVNGRFFKFIIGGFGPSEPVGILNIDNKILLEYVDEPEGNHVVIGLMRLTDSGIVDSTFGQNGVFSSKEDLYPWLHFHVHAFTTIDSQSIFMAGYYGIFGNDNMFVNKINLNDPSVSATEPGVSSLRCFPNPVQYGSFYLDLSSISPFNNGHLYLRDVHGRVVAERTLTATGAPEEITVSHLPNGVYFVEMVAAGTRYRGKIMIQK